MVPSVNTYGSTPTYSTESKDSLGKDEFLKLLIAQLKNQDPMNPTDGTEFSAQLAQFSSLEQLSNLNDNVTQSMQANYLLTQSINNTMSAALIGKEVKIGTDTFKYSGQNKLDFDVNLSAAPSKSEVTITNASGQVVKTFDNSLLKGDNKLSWDFTDNNGNKVAEGEYTIKVSTSGYTSGQNITATTYVQGILKSVKFSDNGTILVVNDTEYSISDVSEILNASTEGN